MASAAPPFLRIPPFPGARIAAFEAAGTASPLPARAAWIDALRRHRVGGNYWVPTEPTTAGAVLLRSDRLHETAASVAERLGTSIDARSAPVAASDVDLWSLIEPCAALVCEADDPARLVAAVLDRPTYIDDSGKQDDGGLDRLEGQLAALTALGDPFGGEPLGLLDAIALCGFWRRLAESNRGLAGGLGFAFWKQQAVAPLLWDGGRPLPFWSSLPSARGDGAVALWRSKAPRASVEALQRSRTPLVEVEDGFLRSRGLGADCIPPLSIIADRRGIYFAPSRPSDLESILAEGSFSSDLLARAKALRQSIVAAGLGKYGQGFATLDRPGGNRRVILVPGQVEDDRSVMEGGGEVRTNLDLLRQVRAIEPDAYILYKPHPDVLAGHRSGDVADREARKLADAVVGDQPIAPLLDMVDAVHVNTSLAGFEALMRGKPVTTHGVPFYAGWGLTEDRGDVPARRNAQRTIDELVAAALLVYPRYLDPESGLPCPAEVVVRRLTEGAAPDVGVLVRLRRWQGVVMRQWRKLVG